MKRAQWGIVDRGAGGYEEGLLGQAAALNRDVSVQAHDNEADHKVLIYGPKGQALVSQRPRPVGFRPR